MLIIKRDFTFHKDQIISYRNSLRHFIGRKISRTEIGRILKEENPDNDYYNSLNRKFATIEFYGFVYFEDGVLLFNPYFDDYVNSLINDDNVISNFLSLLRTSKYRYYGDANNVNFFILLINLLQDNTVQYVDHIDVITCLQHFDKLNDENQLRDLIAENRGLNFVEKVEFLERFYNDNELTDIANSLHNAKYLFTFLEANGFYTLKNSLQTKSYYQGETKRTLEDRRLYLSEELLSLINGFDFESIIDELEYNSEFENECYDESSLDDVKLVDKSQETNKSISRRYKTDKKLRNTALLRSSYSCELAVMRGDEHVTFESRLIDKDYAEVHHLIPMHAQENDSFVQGDELISLDQLPNLIVLCPTCHRKIHYGRDEDVQPDLELLFEERIEGLKEHSLDISKEQLLRFYKISS